MILTFNSINISYAQESKSLYDYSGYFVDNGDFICSSGGLACKAPCATSKPKEQKKEIGIH